MEKYLRVFASGILLSGCANGGAFVSAGTIDYGKLSAALRCEVEDVFDYDRDDINSPRVFYPRDMSKAKPWRARVAVKINGQFDRGSTLSIDLANYSLGGPHLLTAGGAVSNSLSDAGAVILGNIIQPGDQRTCDREYAKGYDISKLGLLAWYKNFAARIKTPEGTKFVSQLSYVQTGKFVFGKNQLKFSLFSPVSVSPGFDFTNAQTAEITVVFDKPSGNDVVELGDDTLKKLAKIIASGGKAKISGPAAKPEQPADLLRDRELEKLNDRFDTFIGQ
jgi:hypothetical protein